MTRPPPGTDDLRALRRRLAGTLAGGALWLNSYLALWIYRDNPLAAEVCAALAALVLACPILLSTFRDLRQGKRSLPELVAIGVLAALVQGDLRTAAAVAFFLQLGLLIESRSAAGARAAVEALLRLAPETACRVAAEGEETVAAAVLQPGDVVRVRAGENIPADGTVIGPDEVITTIDASSVTGESLPHDCRGGDEVFAGTTNLTGVLELQVTRAGGDTTVGRVRELILQAETTRLPVQRLIDRYAGAYTPAILMIAGLVWFFTRDPSAAVATLVVAVPGAFVLAAPTAMVAALSAAARLGVLIKDVGQLETAARLDTLLFDKTGTLTTGELAVAKLQPLDGLTAAELVRLAAGVERGSRHPAGAAIARLATTHRVPVPEPTGFEEAAGQGVRALVDGLEVRAGTAAWMLAAGVDPARFEVPDTVHREGVSLVYCVRDGRPAGWLGLSDQVRPEAAEALAELRATGVTRQTLLTGDREAVAQQVASELGIDEVQAERLPWEKVDVVRELRRQGRVVGMVGDGVNDGAALAAADLGLAFGAAGSDVALNSAGIALLRDDLRLVAFVRTLARQARAVVNQNLAAGLLLILAGLTATGLGWLTPVGAGVVYNLGILVVALNSARLLRAGEELAETEGS